MSTMTATLPIALLGWTIFIFVIVKVAAFVRVFGIVHSVYSFASWATASAYDYVRVRIFTVENELNSKQFWLLLFSSSSLNVVISSFASAFTSGFLKSTPSSMIFHAYTMSSNVSPCSNSLFASSFVPSFIVSFLVETSACLSTEPAPVCACETSVDKKSCITVHYFGSVEAVCVGVQLSFCVFIRFSLSLCNTWQRLMCRDKMKGNLCARCVRMYARFSSVSKNTAADFRFKTSVRLIFWGTEIKCNRKFQSHTHSRLHRHWHKTQNGYGKTRDSRETDDGEHESRKLISLTSARVNSSSSVRYFVVVRFIDEMITTSSTIFGDDNDVDDVEMPMSRGSSMCCSSFKTNFHETKTSKQTTSDNEASG